MRTGRAVVTGAASGIGRATVGELDRRGWTVLATGLEEGVLARVAAEDGWSTRVERARLDVTVWSEWEAVASRMASAGGWDLLCNVAGWLWPGDIAEASPEVLDRHLDVNVRGVMYGTRAAAGLMVTQGRGHVVNIASLAGLSPVPGLAAYSASKFAVRGFSLSAAMELAGRGVAVTVVCPDAVQTPMLDLQKDKPHSALVFTGGRALTAQEVASCIAGRVVRDRPLEVALPGHRGWVSRLGGLAPGLMRHLEPVLRRQGERAQARMRGGDR